MANPSRTVFQLPPESEAPGTHTVCDELRGTARSLFAVEALLTTHRPGLFIADNIAHAHRLYNELCFFAAGRLDICLFPDWEVLAYETNSPDSSISATRLAMLAALPDKKNCLHIIASNTLMQHVVPRSFIGSRCFSLRVGDRLDTDAFGRRLIENGYTSVSSVSTPGEYAVRGALIDFYPPGADYPVRIDLFDDEIESLRLFDAEKQISHTKTDTINISPVREFPFDEESVTAFRRRYRLMFEGALDDHPIYRDIGAGHIPDGIEVYSPLFFERMETLFDYLADDTVIFHTNEFKERLEQNEKYIKNRYEVLKETLFLPPPDQLYSTADEIDKRHQPYTRYELCSVGTPKRRNMQGHTSLIRGVALNHRNVSDSLNNLKKLLARPGNRTLFTAVSEGYKDRLLESLLASGIKPHPVEHWAEFLKSEHPSGICIGELTDGTLFNRNRTHRTLLIPDCQIFGYQPQMRRQRTHTPDADALIQSLGDLKKGMPVVHEEHGIGRYQGLTTLEIGGYPAEFLVVVYAGNDKIYVPVSSLHLVTRYIGDHSGNIPLHSLGDSKWSKAKSKAAQKAYDMAVELLDTNARRDLSEGIRYTCDTDDYYRFCDLFPYEETPDQSKAMREIIGDMSSLKPMDRIICGDVGFGKTELAMRAAFLAVHNGYQVIVLVPTTLLAYQHTQNFRTRFSEWPVRIEMLSRFSGRKEQLKTLEGLKSGHVDIIIGTHRLLQSDVLFKRPGLFIVDEEQRFGVRHKEKIKSMCVLLDILTLTATPIPRTLSMSLNGIRDISIIATPPPHRYPVKTTITQWDKPLLREVCQRELHRGGQIYFLHNRVQSIEAINEQVKELIPEASVGIAHGQMSEHELETTMLNFYRRRFDVLICTTIIESGLDIPSVNTIIIHQAERLGLAQLHQLRGRVGRSHRQAYAYLVLERPMSELPGDAIRRLEAIDSLSEVGVGFSLAAHDLEIRGAGELLGAEQSGNIHEVGFRMYHDMVTGAVTALRSGKVPNPDTPLDMGTEVNIGEPALIPEDYVPDANLRLLLYRRIAAIKNPERLNDMQAEMIDRFGTLPRYARNLLRNAELRLRGERIGVRRIEVGADSGRLYFLDNATVDTDNLMRLISGNSDDYKLVGGTRLQFKHSMENIETRYTALHRLFDELSPEQVTQA